MMAIYKILFPLFAVSLPIVVLTAVGRHLVSAFRSLRNRRMKFAVYSALAIAGILLVLAGMAVVWFAYGVGHSGKTILNELILVLVTAILIYGGSYGLWRFARFIDSNSSGDAT
jgi:hypothetical protein